MTDLQKKKTSIPADRSHQRWMLRQMKETIYPKDSDIPFGTLTPKDFFRVSKELSNARRIRAIPDYYDFYKTDDNTKIIEKLP